ncbi:hypothetical protein OBK08_11765 [Empedobacter falsenii]
MNNYYITNISDKIKEGGMARNNAFYMYFLETNYKIINLNSTSNIKRIIKMIYFIYICLYFRNKNIFIHIEVIKRYLPPSIFINYLRKLFKRLINHLDKNNELIIEVNDLSYEQAFDLGLPINENFKIFQEDVFNLKNAKYIFASEQMRLYTESKYIKYNNSTSTILNGSPKLDITIQLDTIIVDLLDNLKNKAIYSGTLNKGRDIEKLINIFKYTQNWNLILIGSNGEWISKEILPSNVFYLGNFEENVAHKIVSKCDLGLLPYDSSKFYYNLCYPTKVPFYFSAGISILSVPLNEIKSYDYECIMYLEIEQWSEYLLRNDNKIEYKNIESNLFIWRNIIKRNDIIRGII